MADFLHQREHLSVGDIVAVNCSHQCNVMLLSDGNFSAYRSGRGFDYYGGRYKRFPVRLSPPSSGYWNVVLDLGGGSARITHSIRIIKRS